MLGVPATPWGQGAKVFGHQTLRANVALLDDELLQQINASIAAAGREVFAKKEGAPLVALEVKVDTYVLETDVHFPTDLNPLWDAGCNEATGTYHLPVLRAWPSSPSSRS
jgi:transposase, IS5 family